MAFDAGAVKGSIILDPTKWTAGVKTVQKSNAAFKKTLKAVGTGVLAVGTAIAGALTASIVKADEWQKSFSNVRTLVDEAQVDVQGMAKELLVMDGRLGSAKDLTEGLYQAISASVEPAEAVKFVGEAAKFAGAALVSTNTAVDVITTGLNAYGLEADAATSISDKLFTVIKTGKTTGDELAATIGQSIPLAANMGISFDELGASISVMTRQGIKSAEATTQFNAVVNAFLKPSEEMTDNLKAMGFESGSAAIEQLGFKGALEAVTGSTDGSKEALSGLFSNTRALRGAMALTGEGAKDFDSILNEITDSTGATDTAFQKQEKTFATFKNTSGNLAVIVGNIGKSFADELAVGATEAADGMIKFLVSGQGAEVVSNIIAGVTSGFELFKKVLGPIVNVLLVEGKELFGTIGAAIDDLGGGTAEAAGAFNILSFGVNVVTSVFKVMSTTLQAAITNVSNLITAIRLSGGVVDNFFKFLSGKKKWGEVVSQADAAGKAFKTFALEMGEGYKDVFGTIVDEAKGFREKVTSGAKEMDVVVKTTFKTTKDNVKSVYGELITGQAAMVDAVTAGVESVGAALDGVAENTKTTSDEATMIITDNMLQVERIARATAIQRMLFERRAQFEIDAIRQATFLAEQERQEQLQLEYQKTASQLITTFGPVLDSVGVSLIENFNLQKELSELQASAFETEEEFLEAQSILLGKQETVWQGIKKASLNAIAGVVRGFAEQWALQSAAAFFAGNFASGAGFAAASAAGFVAAAAIPGFARGGVAQGPAIVGENGPELVNFGEPSRVFPSDETSRMMGAVTQNNTIYVNNDATAEMMSRKLGRQLQKTRRGN